MIDVSFLNYLFMQRALITGLIISISLSLLGVFVVLRKMSMLGDGLAHISFGGLALGAFFNVYPLFGALLFSLASALGIEKLKRHNLYSDLAIAVFFSFGLAIGVIGLSSLNFGTNLLTYLFGSIVSINNVDMLLAIFFSILSLATVYVLRRQLFLITFDQEMAIVAGVPVDLLNKLLISLVAVLIVVSIKVMGILLVSSLLTIPVACAINLKKGFKETTIISMLVASVSVIAGLLLSYYYDIASGGAVVMVLIGFFVFSILYRKMF